MKPIVSYWLDNNNIICQVDEAWDGNMDADSWSDKAASGSVIGKPLFDFICDDVTRMYVATMIDSVRIIPTTLCRPYRCDSPTEKRFMQMIISREANGWIKVAHELLRTEPLRKRLDLKAATSTDQLKSYCTRCSLCNRIKGMDGNDWHELDSALAQSSLSEPKLTVIYGVCPDCIDLPIRSLTATSPL